MTDPGIRNPGLAPRCSRCARRHLVELPCWSGRYAQRVTAAVLAHYGPVCVHCGKDTATTAEHVTPRSRGGTDALENLRPADALCNQRRGTKAMKGYGAVTTVVTGPPRAGKLAWILDRAQRGDVVVDLDRIAAALTVGLDESTGLPGQVRHVAIGARKAAIERAMSLSEGIHVWIVHAIPTPAQRGDYALAGAELVTVDPGEAETYRRCEGNPGAIAAARRWYATLHAVRP